VNTIDQSAMIETMKIACLKATSSLCIELFRRFPYAKIMSVHLAWCICNIGCVKKMLLGISSHILIILRLPFSVGKKIKGGVVVPRLLNSMQINVQVFYSNSPRFWV
jgi:hypothetical protein